MKYNTKSKTYSIEYAKKKLKRVPLDLTIEKYAELKAVAKVTGEGINGMIKRLVDEEVNRVRSTSDESINAIIDSLIKEEIDARRNAEKDSETE